VAGNALDQAEAAPGKAQIARHWRRWWTSNLRQVRPLTHRRAGSEGECRRHCAAWFQSADQVGCPRRWSQGHAV